jgi:hypothetical protein
MYTGLSDIQKQKFKEISGHDYKDGELKGWFRTMRPYNKSEWDISPSDFSYIFHRDTGFLICELSNRIYGKKFYGWEYEGSELPEEIVKSNFPIHFF